MADFSVASDDLGAPQAALRPTAQAVLEQHRLRGIALPEVGSHQGLAAEDVAQSYRP